MGPWGVCVCVCLLKSQIWNPTEMTPHTFNELSPYRQWIVTMNRHQTKFSVLSYFLILRGWYLPLTFHFFDFVCIGPHFGWVKESFRRKPTFLLLIILIGDMQWLMSGVCHRLHSSREVGEGKGAPRGWELKGLQCSSLRWSNKSLRFCGGNGLPSWYLTVFLLKSHPLTSHVTSLTFKKKKNNRFPY